MEHVNIISFNLLSRTDLLKFLKVCNCNAEKGEDNPYYDQLARTLPGSMLDLVPDK